MKTILSCNLSSSQISSENIETLQLANKNKNQLLAAVAHEVRNPLSNIYNCAILLEAEAGASLSKDCLEYLENIKNFTRETLDLADDLLDVSQANSGKFDIDLSKKIDVKSVILGSIKLNKYLALKQKINILSEIEDDLPLINLDKKRTKQILVNLISNSIKYSDPRTQIKITASLINEKQLEIIICDQGFGMDENEIFMAMKEYSTINNRNSGNVDAFGLGLPLVKQLVEMQKGKMTIKSKKGQGTEVVLRFDLF